MSLLQNSNAISEGGYPISNSLRFQAASSQSLSRTPSSASNRKTWTWSAWVKRGALTSAGTIFGLFQGYQDTNNRAFIYFNNNSSEFGFVNSVSGVSSIVATSADYRDPSSWYHLMVAADTTQATASNRIKLYVNGSQITALQSTGYPSQNTDMFINANLVHYLGNEAGGANRFFDGYMTEINFIDGQALTPSSFGETDATTGQWVAKKYTGTYGTNGFYLPFSNGTSTTTLGYDSSGNSNNWTLNNFTRSAGVSDCWMIDVPSGNGGASGTQPSSNYAVLNPIETNYGAISQGNLNVSMSVTGTTGKQARGTILIPTTGKYYFEVIPSTLGVAGQIGIAKFSSATNGGNGTTPAFSAGDVYLYLSNGQKQNGVTIASYGASYTTSDVIGVALDSDAGTITFYKNNVSQGSAYTGLTLGDYYPAIHASGATGTIVCNVNFGQRSFAYTPPTGFKALCTANLPAATIQKGNQYMDATTYTGNGTGQSIVNAGGFNPDLVWIKARSAAEVHVATDSVRGVNSQLIPNLTDAQYTRTDQIQSFNSNGFTLGADGAGWSNTNARTYVAWQWDAGSSTVTNTSGSISSQVRANPTAGFSVVTYTTPSSGSNMTVGHGLGVSPSMIIVKPRASGAWINYHRSNGNTGYTSLNQTIAFQTDSGAWGNTTPTSSVFNLGNIPWWSASTNYVAYCFSEIAGFSKFTSYVGNGSTDGTFVYTGFRPKFVMVKRTDTTGNWRLVDTVRTTFNATQNELYPNLSNAEGTATYDILSNGFKMRETSADYNASGGTYIYMAFAENPFANSNAR